MANPILSSCCRCQSLRTGSIIAGVGAILLSIVFLIVMLTVRVTFRTILFDWLPKWIVQIVIGFNLCMTILISIIMIVGVIKVSNLSSTISTWVKYKIFNFFIQRNHYLMLPWVVLGFMLVIGMLLSVIYTGVMYIIDGFVLWAVIWLIVGLIVVGKNLFLDDFQNRNKNNKPSAYQTWNSFANQNM